MTMKCEHLANGSDDCPLIRLFDFTELEAKDLHRRVEQLHLGEIDSFTSEDLGIESINRTCLVFCSAWRDRGIIGTEKSGVFRCELTKDSWDNVAGLLEPFAEGARGFQWLMGAGDTKLLISSDRDGQW